MRRQVVRTLAEACSALKAGARAEAQQLSKLHHSAVLSDVAQATSGRAVNPESWSKARIGFGFAATALAFGGVAACQPSAAVAATEAKSVAGSAAKGTAVTGVDDKRKVIFVLGGPGSGKGTQCERLVKEHSHIAHFSAGDLLRAHVNSGTPEGNMVADMIKNGQIVPAEVTVGLLQQAMAKSGKSTILIDGFPRNVSNRETFERVVGYDCEFVLFFDCPEHVLEQRLLSRNQGRVDDNIETIKKRFKVFVEQSMPVIAHYDKLGKVRHIDTNRPVEVIYKEVSALFV